MELYYFSSFSAKLFEINSDTLYSGSSFSNFLNACKKFDRYDVRLVASGNNQQDAA